MTTIINQKEQNVCNCTCGKTPTIDVKNTEWGAPDYKIQCQSCGFKVSATEETHVKALRDALIMWNALQENRIRWGW